MFTVFVLLVLVSRTKIVLFQQQAVSLRRKIMFVQAYDDGNFSRSGWKIIWFKGRSVYNLMLAIRQEGKISLRITLCVRAGPYGRLTPLVMDLPHSEETMSIIVLTRGTPGEKFWVFVCVRVEHLLSAFYRFQQEMFKSSQWSCDSTCTVCCIARSSQ
jgi:hypothetical protein